MNNLSEEDAMLAGKAVNNFIRRVDGAENRAGTAGQALFYILFNLHSAHYLGDPKEFAEHASLTFLLFLAEYGRGEDARGVIENLRLACDNAERMMAAAQLAGSAPDDGPKPAGRPFENEEDSNEDTWTRRFRVLYESAHDRAAVRPGIYPFWFYGYTPLEAVRLTAKGQKPMLCPALDGEEVEPDAAGQQVNAAGQVWHEYAEQFSRDVASYEPQDTYFPTAFPWENAIPWFRRGTDVHEAARHHSNGTDPETIPLLSEQDTDTNNG